MDTLSKFLGVNRSEMQHVFDMGQLKPSFNKNDSISHLSSDSRAVGLRKLVRLNSHGEISSDDDNDIVCTTTSQSYHSPISSWSGFNAMPMEGYPEAEQNVKYKTDPMGLGMEARNKCYQTEREGPRIGPRTGTLPCHMNTNNMAHNQSQGRVFVNAALPANRYEYRPLSSETERNWGFCKGFTGQGSLGNQNYSGPLYYQVPTPSHDCWQYNSPSEWQGMYPHSHQLGPSPPQFMQVNSFPTFRPVQMASIPPMPGPRVGLHYGRPVYNVVAGMMPVWFGNGWGSSGPLVFQHSQQTAANPHNEPVPDYSYRTPRAAPRKYAKPHRRFPQQSSDRCFEDLAKLPTDGLTQESKPIPCAQGEANLENAAKSDSHLPATICMPGADVHSSNCDPKIVSTDTSEVDQLATVFNHLDVASHGSESYGHDTKPQVCDTQDAESVIPLIAPERQQELFKEEVIVNDTKGTSTADDKVISGDCKCACSQSQNTADFSGGKMQDRTSAPRRTGSCHLPQPCKMVFGSIPKLLHRKKKKARPSAEKRRRRKTRKGEQVTAERPKAPQICHRKLKPDEQSITASGSNRSPADSGMKKTPCQMSKSVAFILGLDISEDHIEEDVGSDFDNEFTPVEINTSFSFIVGASDSDFDESDSLDGCSGGTTEPDISGIWESLASFSDPYNPLNFHVHCSIQSTPIKKCASAPELIQVAKEGEEEVNNKEVRKRDCPGDVASQPMVPGKQVQFASDPDLVTVYVLEDYPEEYQDARKGPWEYYALDRCRFMNRVEEVGRAIGHVFDSGHRSRIFNERYLLVND